MVEVLIEIALQATFLYLLFSKTYKKLWFFKRLTLFLVGAIGYTMAVATGKFIIILSFTDFILFLLNIFFREKYDQLNKPKKSGLISNTTSDEDSSISELDSTQDIKLNDSENDKSDFEDKVKALKKRPKVHDSKNVLNDNKNSSEDIIEKIEKLSELKEKGILTDDEFDDKKKELLDRI